MVGHSLGEVAAAYASGALTLKEAILVQVARAEQQVTKSQDNLIILKKYSKHFEKYIRNIKRNRNLEKRMDILRNLKTS